MRSIFTLALLILPVFLMAQSFDYEIRGSIKSYRSGQKMYFQHSEQGSIIDSALIVNGSFSFKGKADLSKEPDEHHKQSSARLFIDQRGKGIAFNRFPPEKLDKISNIKLYLQPGITQVDIAGATAVIKRSYANSGYYILDSINKAQTIKINAAVSEDERRYGIKNDFSDYAAKQIIAINTEYRKNLWQFIKYHSSSPVSLYIMKHNIAFDATYAELAPFYYGLSPQLKQTTFGKKYGNFVNQMKNVQVGKFAPAFTLKTPNDKPVTLASFKGKYLLLDFWASWCGPCRENNPDLLKTYNKFKGRNFTVLGISLDSHKDEWKKAIVEDRLKWTHVSDLKGWDNAVAKLYAVKFIPQQVLIDPHGRIIAHGMLDGELDKKLSEIFDKK